MGTGSTVLTLTRRSQHRFRNSIWEHEGRPREPFLRFSCFPSRIQPPPLPDVDFSVLPVSFIERDPALSRASDRPIDNSPTHALLIKSFAIRLPYPPAEGVDHQNALQTMTNLRRLAVVLSSSRMYFPSSEVPPQRWPGLEDMLRIRCRTATWDSYRPNTPVRSSRGETDGRCHSHPPVRGPAHAGTSHGPLPPCFAPDGAVILPSEC